MGFPTREAELLVYATAYSATLSLDPGVYGQSVSTAADLASKVSTFDAAYAEFSNPATRTSAKRVAKDVAKNELLITLRRITAMVQANPLVSPEQKTLLGVTLRDKEPSPIPAPGTRPVLTMVGLAGNDMLVRVFDETTPTSRAKPYGVVGCEVRAWVGENAPEDLNKWETKGIATKGTLEITFGLADAGKEVTIIGRWFNRKGEFGPMSEPLVGRIAGGVAQAA